MRNGSVLTAPISFPRTDPACSLSDVLEEQVPARYYLRPRALRKLLEHAARHQEKGNGFGINIVDASGLGTEGGEPRP